MSRKTLLQRPQISSSPTRASRFSWAGSVLLGAQLVAPAMSVTKVQTSLESSNLPVLLSGCAAIIGAALVALARLIRPSGTGTGSGARIATTAPKSSRDARLVPTALLGLGGVLQAGAPTVWIWGLGTLFAGIGAGIWLLGRPADWPILRGLIVGPLIGVALTLVSWRAVALVALVSAVVVYFVSDRGQDPTPTPTSGALKRTRVAGGFVLLTSCAIVFPAALFFVRNATILKESPLPLGVMLAAGGWLGLWRGRVMAQRSLARRSIRQGVFIILLAGVGGALILRDSFTGPVPIVLAFIVAFGGSRIVASSFSVFSGTVGEPNQRLRAMSPVLLGLFLGVIPLATAGHESLFWQVNEVRQTYPNSRTLAELDRGILSLPASFEVANDPRVGELAGPIRSAATFMTKQHLALALLFSSGIGALLALAASLALPRQRRRPESQNANPRAGEPRNVRTNTSMDARTNLSTPVSTPLQTNRNRQPRSSHSLGSSSSMVAKESR
jgi:hypothetical protein